MEKQVLLSFLKVYKQVAVGVGQSVGEVNGLTEILRLESVGKAQLLIILLLSVWQLRPYNWRLLENYVLTRIIPPLFLFWFRSWLLWFNFCLFFRTCLKIRGHFRSCTTLWARPLDVLVNVGIFLRLGEHIHALPIELLHAPSEVEDVECVTDAHSEPFHSEVEPVSVSLRVRVHF